MKKPKLLAALLAGALLVQQSAVACTNILVTKGASKTGSTMISYSADSHTLYGELYYRPAGDYPAGTMMKVYEWDTGKLLGEIPQASHTYSVVGNMNEHQLLIGESTWGGLSQLVDPHGIIDYGSLMYIALQRAKTAREALKVMTELVAEYGYASSGESISIADPNEVWVLEIIGKGVKMVDGKNANKGAVWVARRIPDGAISAHANQARITTFPLDDPENCIYSPDVISFAREQGLYNGSDKDFDFAAVYNPMDYSSMRGCEARVWSVFRQVTEGMDKYLDHVTGKNPKNRLPLWVTPNRKLTVKDVAEFMRNHFEGTELDMTCDPGAGPFKVPYRFRPMTFEVDSQEYINERAIATQQTGFSLVAQQREWLPSALGGVLWFGVDDANTSVYVPIYVGALTEVPLCFREGNGSLYKVSWTSAFWIYNWVANMAYARYDQMIEDIRPLQRQIETAFNEQQPKLEKSVLDIFYDEPAKALATLDQYSREAADSSTVSWREEGENLMVKYLDWNRKREKDGQFLYNPYGLPEYPDFPGYSDDYYRAIVEDAGERLKVSF